MKPGIFTVVLAALLTSSPFASAQSGGMKDMDMKGMEMKKESKPATAHKGIGVVKSTDAKKGTVTIAHEPVQSMSWPAMTMAFIAKDKKAAESLKPGQKVEFEFVKRGSDYVITSIK